MSHEVTPEWANRINNELQSFRVSTSEDSKCLRMDFDKALGELKDDVGELKEQTQINCSKLTSLEARLDQMDRKSDDRFEALIALLKKYFSMNER